MAIVVRGGHRYLYQSVRRRGRVTSEYRGADLLVDLYAGERAGRREEAEAARRSRAAILAGEREADEAFDRVERVFRSAMKAAGYHKPGRGPWRRRRMGNQAAAPLRASVAEARSETPGGVVAEIRLANSGDVAAMKRVRDRFADGGKGTELAGLLGSPEYNASENAVKVFAGTSPVAAAAARQTLEGMRRDLTGPDAPPLEKMLADRVAYCWFRLYQAEAAAARPDVDLTIGQSEFMQRRIDLAHRRHLSAVKALAVVRKLGLPSTSVTLSQSVSVKLQPDAGLEAADTNRHPQPLALDGGPDRA